MKEYGESTFDILYLIFAITIGILILIRSKNYKQRLMGIASLVLGCGDAFHLVPRMLNYFVEGDFNTAIGVGKLVTSITMTVFYVLIYHVYLHFDGVEEKRVITAAVYLLSAVRIILCCFPQNCWIENDSPYLWGILRNIPFLILGILIIVLYFTKREIPHMRLIWLYITLSFAFYLVVVLGASYLEILGMFMLPKTICYVLILLAFYRSVQDENKITA